MQSFKPDAPLNGNSIGNIIQDYVTQWQDRVGDELQISVAGEKYCPATSKQINYASVQANGFVHSVGHHNHVIIGFVGNGHLGQIELFQGQNGAADTVRVSTPAGDWDMSAYGCPAVETASFEPA